MDPVSAAIMGGAMLGAGGISSLGQSAANHANRKFTREMFNKQKDLDNTAVQRRVWDLREAGMNPLLAASGGAAGTPSASSVTAGNAGKAFADQIDPVSLMALEKSRADIDQTDAQRKLLEIQQDAAKKQNELTDMQIQWYKDHPGYAPGIQDNGNKGLISLYDFARSKVDKFKNYINDLSDKTGKTWLYGDPKGSRGEQWLMNKGIMLSK